MAMADARVVSSSLIRESGIPEGGFVAVEATIDGEYESIILHRDAQGVRAWLNVCPHAGRRLDYLPGQFLLDRGLLVCAAHGATFRTTDGECVAGPCRGAHLRAVAVEVREGEVWLGGT
jgi:nitrite reductase/ring-hydroxylating ferredoxin subunit